MASKTKEVWLRDIETGELVRVLYDNNARRYYFSNGESRTAHYVYRKYTREHSKRKKRSYDGAHQDYFESVKRQHLEFDYKKTSGGYTKVIGKSKDPSINFRSFAYVSDGSKIDAINSIVSDFCMRFH